MSYFRNMVKAPDDLVLRFSWEVNGHGEVVVWSLDAEGRRIKMAAAPAVDMLNSLVAVGGTHTVVKVPTPETFTGMATSTWAEIVEVLNGPPCALRKAYELTYVTLNRLGVYQPLEWRHWLKRPDQWALKEEED